MPGRTRVARTRPPPRPSAKAVLAAFTEGGLHRGRPPPTAIRAPANPTSIGPPTASSLARQLRRVVSTMDTTAYRAATAAATLVRNVSGSGAYPSSVDAAWPAGLDAYPKKLLTSAGVPVLQTTS